MFICDILSIDEHLEQKVCRLCQPMAETYPCDGKGQVYLTIYGHVSSKSLGLMKVSMRKLSRFHPDEESLLIDRLCDLEDSLSKATNRLKLFSSRSCIPCAIAPMSQSWPQPARIRHLASRVEAEPGPFATAHTEISTMVSRQRFKTTLVLLPGHRGGGRADGHTKKASCHEAS